MKPYTIKDVVNNTYKQLSLIVAQFVKIVNSIERIPKKYKKDVLKLQKIINDSFTYLFKKIENNLPTSLPHHDPVDVFQDVLSLFHNEIMTTLRTFCHTSIIMMIFEKDKINAFLNLWDNILSKKISLKNYAKSHWSLQDIYKDIIYPRCNGDKKKAWKYIFKVYSNDYYTGLNYNHENGEEIKGNYSLLKKPKYTDAFDWDKVKRGDIIFSDEGFMLAGHFTGHCAIIDGWYTAKVQITNEVVKYLRIIEANEYGISYGLLDDVRMRKGEITVLRIKTANKKQVEAATKFCESQLGKHYNIPIFLSEDTSPDTAAWYCSELVWAAYINQGIDIQKNNYYPIDIPGIIPWEIFYCKDAEVVISYSDSNKKKLV